MYANVNGRNVEQLGHLHSRIAIDEMQHTMVGAPEAKRCQHLVRIADEITIGEEQKFDQIPIGLGALHARLALRRRTGVAHGCHSDVGHLGP